MKLGGETHRQQRRAAAFPYGKIENHSHSLWDMDVFQMAVMGALEHFNVLHSTDYTCRNWQVQWLMPAIPALRRLRWKDQYFRASLGHIAKPRQKKQNKTKP